MYFQLLGTLRVQHDGDRIDLGGLRQQRLLAMLLLDVNRVVSAERLIEAMWDGEPPATARRQLHNAVAAIRRGFAAAKHILVKDGPGYRIQVDPQDIDAHRFTRMIERAVADGGRTSAAVELLEAGLALWQGPALSGLNSPVLDIVAATLEEKRLSATERLLELRLASGDAAALVPRLGELVSQHPLREETRRLLMLALHHTGRKADALSVYEQGRRLLRDEIGLDPSASLRQLYERILRDELRLPNAPATQVVVLSDTGGRSFLPYDTAHFTGRGDELSTLLAPGPASGTALGIVAIDGMPGVGKTTLAVALAHRLADRYPDGQLFLDLHGHTPGRAPLTSDAALERLLSDIGLEPARIPGDSTQRAARWRAELARRRILLVLDNALDARQVRPLLPGTPTAHVIITSQRRLAGLDGVTSHSLDVLSRADAAALFTRIVGTDRVRDRADAVAEIAALCGCLPLALSAAASRFHNRPAWSLGHLLFRLRDQRRRLAELSYGDRGVTAAFDASYRTLSAGQRRLFCVLGFATHPGEQFDAAATAALLNLPVSEADRLLEELFDAHLLRQRTAGRYHFHDLLREYACAKVGEGLAISDVARPDAGEYPLDALPMQRRWPLPAVSSVES